MLSYITRRLLIMIPTVIAVSILTFVIIELPPGDYVTSYAQSLKARGIQINQQQLEMLRREYGLDKPVYQRYFHWMRKLLKGDMGQSFTYGRPVAALIKERLPMTMMISILTILFTWALALPISLYSAVRQYTIPDYIFTLVGFIGLSIPNFFLAIILMYIGYKHFGVSMCGLFSREYLLAPWSLAKFKDLLAHIWVPIIVIGTAGTAGMIRVLRATLLDELSKDYVRTARAKGLPELKLLIKHPLRMAINPLISTVGWLLPSVIGGEIVTSQVLSLPTTGPLLLGALLNQDMYLAGSFVMVLSILTVIGTLISDLALAFVDPRIRYD